MGPSQLGHSLPAKDCWWNGSAGPLSQQYGYGHPHLVEMAYYAIHPLGIPMDCKVCQQSTHRRINLNFRSQPKFSNLECGQATQALNSAA